MKNTSEDLRNHLFETLEMLRDKDEKIDLDRVKAVVDVSQTLINLAKVEAAYAREKETKAKFFEPAPHLKAIGGKQ